MSDIFIEQYGTKIANVQEYRETVCGKNQWGLIISGVELTPEIASYGRNLDDMLDDFSLVIHTGSHKIVYSDCYAGATCELKRFSADKIWVHASKKEEF